ncbi:MAG: tetratricopeptide repeat protein [Bacteroidales bacterium]|nr:tetratricopeptide repeat protein [Bacteroidales bacterium]
MMRFKSVMAAFFVLVMASGICATAQDRPGERVDDAAAIDMKLAMSLYGRGMYERAEAMFASMAMENDDCMAEGYRVLCAEKLGRKGYEAMLDSYAVKYPYSALIPQLRFQHALNLFDQGMFHEAGNELEALSRRQLYRKQITEFLFKKAYCDFECGNFTRAYSRFKEVVVRPASDYTAPSQYTLGYICYVNENFTEAEKWFSESVKDGRFTDISSYYILECRFMQKDYSYVADKGPDMIKCVPDDRRPQLARLISESFLVLGNPDEARSYYEMNEVSGRPKSRSDYFYAGSVLYAVKDWKGAADNFSSMEDRTDSLGQIANYELAFSYIQLKNKVAAMGAFKAASEVGYDSVIEEDAHYNYAKLAFDLNNDMTGFDSYIAKYSDRKRGDRIYAYVAMSALRSRDYAAAVDAYDKIDELDDDMVNNYMKANYLRADQLVSDGSWRAAIPCLKAAAYYSDKRGMFNQLSRFWLAESYYRDGQYDNAMNVLRDLYNTAALYGMEESYLILYNMAFCNFAQENYRNAEKWFTEYLATPSQTYRKEALVRIGDCWFMQRNYSRALESYTVAADAYNDINEIYPYYQAALSQGLLGNNAKKIVILAPVAGADPSADFYPEATYELGRAYARAGDSAKAEASFKRLIDNSRDTTYIAMSLIELGTLARNAGKTEQAMGYYKSVVQGMPVSEYAEDALAAIESIYQSQNDPEGYLAYIDGIGKSSVKTDAEKEQMIFNAAEQIFLSGNWQKALVSLQSYIDRYPEGANLMQAKFYIAESYRASGDREKACDYYSVVMKGGEGSFRELATLHYAELSYRLQKFDDAFEGYSALSATAEIEGNRYVALLGMMRSAYNARRYADAVANAVLVAEDRRTEKAVKTEAVYMEAKSLLAMSRRDEAMDKIASLASDPSTVYGAEAAYLLIQDCYDRGAFDEVENRVYAFSDAGTPWQYWLAKSFIVLGDAFADQGELEQAKATFESILDGYRPEKEDDVKDNVEFRIRRLAEITAGQN